MNATLRIIGELNNECLVRENIFDRCCAKTRNIPFDVFYQERVMLGHRAARDVGELLYFHVNDLVWTIPCPKK